MSDTIHDDPRPRTSLTTRATGTPGTASTASTRQPWAGRLVGPGGRGSSGWRPPWWSRFCLLPLNVPVDRRREARVRADTIAAERLLEDLDHLHPGAIAALAAAGGGAFGTAADDPDVAARAECGRACGESPSSAVASTRSGRSATRLRRGPRARRTGSPRAWRAGERTAEIGPRIAAVPNVLDAAYAVVLVDLLDDDEVDLLLTPWDDVVGSPFGEGFGEPPDPRGRADPRGQCFPRR